MKEVKQKSNICFRLYEGEEPANVMRGHRSQKDGYLGRKGVNWERA